MKKSRIIQEEKALKIACKKEWPNYRPSENIIEKLMIMAVQLPKRRGWRRLGLRYPATFAAYLSENAKIRLNAEYTSIYADYHRRLTSARLKRRRFYTRGNSKERSFRRNVRRRWPWE
ncbi:MAG: hypothetical protein IJV46_06925 [Acidaminococcaceae bacterium]|nr:hypothetical protein [Acidaminococcaceae bacterium]